MMVRSRGSKRRRTERALVLAVLGGLLVQSDGEAAQGGVRFEVTPQAGYYLPLRSLGPVAPAGGAWFLRLQERMDPTVSMGAAAEVARSGGVVGLRLTGLVTLPSDAGGEFHCYPGLACPSILLKTDADVTIASGAAALVWSPLRTGRVRPYALAGVGFRRWSYSWPDAVALVKAGTHAETGVVAQAGVGAAIEIRGTLFRVEVVDLWSGRGSDLEENVGGGRLQGPGRRAQHDLGIVVGWRALRF